uniref:Uncharacterized protein n=1 Tax=Cucumis melo TaxID=3656 RepID=A0A9I9CFZ1_CUCME
MLGEMGVHVNVREVSDVFRLMLDAQLAHKASNAQGVGGQGGLWQALRARGTRETPGTRSGLMHGMLVREVSM